MPANANEHCFIPKEDHKDECCFPFCLKPEKDHKWIAASETLHFERKDIHEE